MTELRHHSQQLQQGRQAAEAEAAQLRQQLQEAQQQAPLMAAHSPSAGRLQQLEQQLKEMGEML